MASPLSLDEREANFISAVGLATLQWSYVENRLFIWFERLTGMKPPMARAVFFSARSFQARAEMITSVLAMGVRPAPLKDEYLELITGIVTKAASYSSYRNRLVHGFAVLLNRENGELYHALVADKDGPHQWGESAKETATIEIIAKNFEELSFIALHGIRAYRQKSRKRTLKCLSQLNALPNEADSEKPSQKQRGRERQRQAAQRGARKKTPPQK